MNFKLKYIIALSLIATFIIITHLVTNNALSFQENLGKLINLSGQQRVLSQKIALLIATSDKSNLKDIENITNKLININKKLKSAEKSDNIKKIYDKNSSFNKIFKEYTQNSLEFAKTSKYENLNFVLQNSNNILKQLNNLVLEYELYNKNELNKTRQNNLVLLVLLLVLLIIELVLIFKPMEKEIKQKILDLENLNSGLEKTVLEKTKELQDKLDIIDNNVIISETNEKGVITSVSSAFCKISQYSKEYLIGKPHNIVRHEDMPKEAFETIWYTIQNGYTWTGEVKNKRKDGSFYWVQSTIAPKKIDGKIVGYLSMRLDITASKKIEELNKNLEKMVEVKTEKLNLLNKNLEDKVKNKTQEVFEMMKKQREKDKMLLQQSKMAIMGEMIAMIAHQWRQPLSAIKAIVQSIEFKNRLNKLTTEFIEGQTKKASETIDHMSKTIDDFRNFFKTDKKAELITIETLINNVKPFIEHSFANHNISLEVDLKFNEKIKILSGEFTQVLMNLLNNAKDALIENNIENKSIIIKSYIDETNIYIDIEDNAGGVPDKIIDKIFDPYFSTKSKNGTGIGLYMSKTIIDEHLSGNLSVQNTQKGAIFNISLPLNIYKKTQG
jgi:PAS domain S-box-containing protein